MRASSSTWASVVAIMAAGAQAVDMSPYQAGPGVEDGFATFVQEYYRVSEDASSTTAYTDFWPADGEMILAGNHYTGTDQILAVRQKLLPNDGSKAWWHLIRGAELQTDAQDSKTYVAEVVIQTTYTPGNCSQAYGSAAFTLAKVDGVVNLTPHTQGLNLYNLTVSTTASPTDEPCSSS